MQIPTRVRVYLGDFYPSSDSLLGNLLIRPAPRLSQSPYNFEIVLLDHGLYFDLDDQLRINYSKFMLALMSPNTAATKAERRKYAKLVGNVDDDLYPIFEAALTGTFFLSTPLPTIDVKQVVQSLMRR